jgi:hypothetical protein
LNSSDGPNAGQNADGAFEFAIHLGGNESRELSDRMADLFFVRCRDEIRAEARRLDQRLALERRRQICREAVLGFVGILIFGIEFLPCARLSQPLIFGLIALAGLTLRREPSSELSLP